MEIIPLMNSPSFAPLETITPERLHDLIQGGKPVEVIDVRTPAEFGSCHASMARSVPLDKLDPHAVLSARTLKGEPLYVMCRSGGRSEKACAAFASAGHGETVVNVEGGLLAWERAGLPVVRGRSVLPLDRQVRIAIGILVLLGSVLGYLVSPWFYLLPAYCGVGLIFGGITGFCPLASTLAGMPWNQAAGDAAACAR